VLAVMARYPALGEVKSRLAETIGAERACALYRAFLQDIEARFARGPRAFVWLYHPPEHDFAALVQPGVRCLPQTGRDLGERLLNGVRRLCDDGYERVIVIGADVPHVRDAWLDEAERQLDVADIVLGPSDDGGYYLVAMRAAHDIFTGIPMGTPRVLDDTLAKAAGAGLGVHLLPRSFDIDGADDLVRLRRLLEEDAMMRLPHTAVALHGWR
jgi:rSAM/selenodomain-associated transferase 1